MLFWLAVKKINQTLVRRYGMTVSPGGRRPGSPLMSWGKTNQWERFPQSWVNPNKSTSLLLCFIRFAPSFLNSCFELFGIATIHCIHSLFWPPSPIDKTVSRPWIRYISVISINYSSGWERTVCCPANPQSFNVMPERNCHYWRVNVLISVVIFWTYRRNLNWSRQAVC